VKVSSIILVSGVVMALAPAVAAVARRPATIPKIAFGAGMALFAAEALFALLANHAASIGPQSNWLRWRLVATSLLPIAWILFSLTYARGNYREFITRWRWILVGVAALPVAVSSLYFPDLVFAVRPWQGSIEEGLFLSWPGNVIQLFGLICAVVVLMNLERTFRSAVGIMRWRLKYTILGLAVIFGERIYSHSNSFLISTLQPSYMLLDALVVAMGAGLMLVAVVRAGFFKVDVYPSHTFLANSLTAILVGIYLLAVGVLAKLVGYFGHEFGPLWQAATVITLLAALGIVLLSDRSRQAFRLFISRHLRRPSYDYRQLWTRFTERTTSVVDPDEYNRTVVKWVAETCAALSVTLWLVDEQRRRLAFGASTSLLDGASARLLPIENVAEVIQQMRQNPVPVDIDSTKEPWVDALRRCNPDHFTLGGHRIGVPLVARGQIVGVLIVGDRVAGRAYTPEDLDLLKCLADQLASALLNIRLGQRVLENKQMEAFQTMSAFFVHDLKNTASTLSLMLQNLPIHFDNPEFRQDALRAVGKTVNHINDLIHRLGLLRKELEVRLAETDVNKLVESSLTAVQGAGDLNVVKSLGVLPPIQSDREQLGKVLTNLLLNARDAVQGLGRPGEVSIQTFRDGEWVAIVVQDDGCGMTQDFVDKQLFKPFQTTKKKGLGIGMFHSRMIVEAHNGRIEVETKAGTGTTFRVLLPINGTVN
jgi:putative PEP-CTERM system histidine kinase